MLYICYEGNKMESEKLKTLGNIRVTEKLHSQIKKASVEDDRTIQDEIRWLLKLGLSHRLKGETCDKS